jgi:hypothetical protein
VWIHSRHPQSLGALATVMSKSLAEHFLPVPVLRL